MPFLRKILSFRKFILIVILFGVGAIFLSYLHQELPDGMANVHWMQPHGHKEEVNIHDNEEHASLWWLNKEIFRAFTYPQFASQKMVQDVTSTNTMKSTSKVPQERTTRKVNFSAPGEMNIPIIIDKNLLSKKELDKYNEGWKLNSFNQFASDMMSVHRTLPDFRPKECREQKYDDLPLPMTSVIIIFHNEAWSTLLRTVHSVLDRSPQHLLKEIILVDDYSTFEHLHKPLEEYFQQQGEGKVRIVRAKKRGGLISARMMGAALSTGEVLTFLDSHIETTEGWLEPLLYHIAQKWTNVAVPIIDTIDDDTFHFHYSQLHSLQVGGFTWKLTYSWHLVPEREKLRRSSLTAPTRSPTMAGGLFSISKKFFYHLGQYDPAFQIWGGENLELSFKIWMCGGELNSIPCSHVGHIFRKKSPYSWGSKGDVLSVNLARVAEVWLDEYKVFYYMYRNFVKVNFGDISDRVALRKQLKCKSFKWYLQNIYPELPVPSQARAHGEIRSYASKNCIDASVDNDNSNVPVILYYCHGQGGNQMWILTRTGEIQREDGCFDNANSFVSVFTQNCHGEKGNQEWRYRQDDLIEHQATKRCLEAGEDMKTLNLAVCDDSNDRQKWKWKRGPLEISSTND